MSVILNRSIRQLVVVTLLALTGSYAQTADDWLQRGGDALREERNEDAHACFSRAIALDPNNTSGHFGRGLVYYRQKKNREAVADFSHVLRLNPAQNNARLFRALCLGFMDRHDEAFDDLNTILTYDPSHADALRERGYEYSRRGQLQSAIKDYTASISSDASDPLTFTLRGVAYFQVKRFQEAISDYTQAVALGATGADVFKFRAQAYRAVGNTTRALEDESIVARMTGRTLQAVPPALGSNTPPTNDPGDEWESEEWDDEYEHDDEFVDMSGGNIVINNGNNSISISGGGRNTSLPGLASESWTKQGANPPELHVTRVAAAGYRGLDVVKKTSGIEIRGTVKGRRPIAMFTVNKSAVALTAGGAFNAILKAGTRSITLLAVDDDGSSTQYIMGFSHIPDASEVIDEIADTTPPEIVITKPSTATTRGLDVVVSQNVITVEGYVRDESGIAYLMVNGAQVGFTTDGFFSTQARVAPGQSAIEILAQDNVGNEGTRTITVKVQPQPVARDVTPPEIIITQPAVEQTRGLDVVPRTNPLTVKGMARDESGVVDVRVNGQYAYLQADGLFSATIPLDPAQTTITVVAADGMGNRAQRVFTVKAEERKPLITALGERRDDALIITTDDYQDGWPALNNPIKDGATLGRELEEVYGFNTQPVLNASRVEILNTLRRYADRTYEERDQLLIFFAGHGYYDTKLQEGYLVCTDSHAQSIDSSGATMIPFTTLREMINRIPCKHILLVMDVCYGGAMDPVVAMRGDADYRDVDDITLTLRKFSLTTRLLLTSGGMEYVSDGQPGKHSPFMRKFLEVLRGYGGSDKILTTNELFHGMERVNPMPRNSEFGKNEPGSDFLFIVRNQ